MNDKALTIREFEMSEQSHELIEQEERYCEGETMIHTGNCLEVMKTMDDNSVDAVVTDPPYGLSLMGKKWDRGVPGVPFWTEALRVLKPGGHLLAFGGTRTFHRLAVAIEDAGFEIRDCLNWLYGQGFPKSANVSKMIDKAAGAEREVVGKKKTRELPNDVPSGQGLISSHANAVAGRRTNGQVEIDITAPATEAAKQWDGWGTALKPSHEPVLWAQKPLTVVPADVMVQAESHIGGLICLSLLSANNVESLLKSNPSASEGVSDSARLIAAVHHIASSGASSEAMGMFKSPEMARTIWSIVGSWSSILAAVCDRESKFTTSMATALTTALQIFNSLTLPITQGNTIQDGKHGNGVGSLAPGAAGSSSGREAKSPSKTSVRENASDSITPSDVSNAGQNTMPAVQAAATVLASATTNLGASLTPNARPIIMARKPLSEKTVAANVLKWGTGGINVDGCRIASSGDHKRSYQPTNNKRQVFGKQSGFQPTNAEGRWPANLVHDGSDEVLAGFPGEGDKSAARFFYCAKASKAERNAGLPAGQTSTHPTVKPVALMRWLVRMVTQPGGIVLDPFMGSGTTGVAAAQEGFRFIGIELNPEYVAIAERRVDAARHRDIA